MAPCSSFRWSRPREALLRFRDDNSAPGSSRFTNNRDLLTEPEFEPVLPLEPQLEGSKFPVLDHLIQDYVRSEPDAASAEQDQALFLNWLMGQSSLDPVEREILIDLYLERSIESTALSRRLAYARYMEMLERTPAATLRLTAESRYSIRLNPIHVWAAVESRVNHGGDRGESSCVLFYQVGKEVHTAILTDDVQHFVRSLERQDLNVSRLLNAFHEDHADTILTTLKLLAELKIVAIA